MEENRGEKGKDCKSSWKERVKGLDFGKRKESRGKKELLGNHTKKVKLRGQAMDFSFPSS